MTLRYPLLAVAMALAPAAASQDDTASMLPFAPDREYTVEELQEGMPRIGEVPGVKLEWVARRMTNNGLPMQIQQFESRRDLDEIVSAYKRRFRRLGVLAPHSDVRGGFAELYGGLGPYFVRLQVGERDGFTTGYLSVIAQPKTVASDRSTELPLPDSVEIKSRMGYDDAGIPAETLMGQSEHLPGILVDDFRRNLESEGWKREGIGAGGREGPAMRTRANLRYSRDGQRLQILIAHQRDRREQSVVVVHGGNGHEAGKADCRIVATETPSPGRIDHDRVRHR
ncbi:MAG: hypothetical protein U5K73_04335 [Halofilum sp. (in: g-proteobacteria)]|nr:hypothetical protein [Halofilum sp. (in: g-proteobacteria)]